MFWEKMNANHPCSCYKFMKTNVMFRRLLGLLILLPLLAHAQPPGALPAPRQAGVASSGKPANSDLYEIVIENGVLLRPTGQEPRHAAPNLAEVVKRLRELHPDANLVLAPELADAPVGDLKLHATEIDQELDALEVAAGNVFKWNVPPAAHQNSPPLYRIVPTAPKPLPAAARVEVFNLTDYLARLSKAHPENPADSAANEKFRKEQVSTAQSVVNQTLTLLGNGYQPLNYEFHSGANLLIVMGNSDSLGIARTVLDGLIMPPPGENQELDMLNGLMKTLQTRSRETQPDVDLRSQLADLNSKLHELKAENEKLAIEKQMRDQTNKPTP